MTCWNVHSAYLKDVDLTQIPVDHRALSIVCHVKLHVDFSSMKFSLGLWALTFYCEVNLNEFYLLVQWEFLDRNGHGPSILVCEVALRAILGQMTPLEPWLLWIRTREDLMIVNGQRTISFSSQFFFLE